MNSMAMLRWSLHSYDCRGKGTMPIGTHAIVQHPGRHAAVTASGAADQMERHTSLLRADDA